LAGSDSVPEQLVKDIQPGTKVAWYLAGSETARCVYDFPPGADANALVIEKWRQTLENSQPLQVLSIDSHGRGTPTRRCSFRPSR
jgi:hypothetical protein